MDNTVSSSEQTRRMANDQFAKAMTLRPQPVDGQPNVGFDDAGVAWLEEFLAAERDSGDEGRFNSAYWLGGAFFGECLLQTVGGFWSLHDDMRVVQFDEQNGMFPFETVLKQLDGEEGASVVEPFAYAQTQFAHVFGERARWLGASRDWWGAITAVDDEITRNFNPRSGTADEILDGAFNIVRHGDARAVTVNIDRCGVDVESVVAQFAATWSQAVDERHPSTVCRYTGDPVVSLDIFGEGGRVDLVDRPDPEPSLQGRDASRF